MSAMRLVLVRHAMPEIDPAMPADRWELGPVGRAAACALKPLLNHPADYVSSTEVKAQQTLQEIAGRSTVATDAGFAEVRRPPVWSAGDTYRDLARAYVQGRCHEGWEKHADVIKRFDAALARHTETAGRTLVIGTHGLAMTLWLAARFDLSPSPAEFWSTLGFPELVDLRSGTVTRVSA
jgi:broad specificity phosphatase PhoE